MYVIRFARQIYSILTNIVSCTLDRFRRMSKKVRVSLPLCLFICASMWNNSDKQMLPDFDVADDDDDGDIVASHVSCRCALNVCHVSFLVIRMNIG